jgi:tripartite-type tricarboxylate transporter receptor subunit TctC
MRRGKVFRSLLAIGVFALIAAACGGGDDYPSEDFTWVVPYSEGGGFDTYSRGFAGVMEDTQLPDGINIGVQNITPIAEGLSSVFASDSEYTLAILPMPAAAAQELQFGDVANWKTDEFTVLGSIEENAYVVYVRADGPYQTYQDLIAASDLKALTVEKGSSSGLATAVTINTLGLDAEITFGAEGSQEVATALVRGDIDFIVYGTSDVLGFIDSGDLKAILFLGIEDQRPPGFDWLTGVPSIADAGFPEAAGSVTEMRVIVAPPGLDEEVVEYLEAAVEATLNSAELATWSEEAGRPLVPRNAASARAAMANQINTMKTLVPVLVEKGQL